MRRSLLVAALAALTICSAAAAHGGGGALGFRSNVTAVTPAVDGIEVSVLDYDDRLDLRNETGKPLVVLGYESEPYLAFRDGRVFRNSRSPAPYLNDDRFGVGPLPAQADPRAAPAWKEVAQREEYDWHDHRIHWMGRALPPKVAAAKDERQHVFDWSVPATLDGRPVRISGSLDYQPPPKGNPKVFLFAGIVIGLGGATAIWMRRRRERARS